MDESQLNTTSAVTFVEIGDQILLVLGIQDNIAYPESDFSVDVFLQYSNLTFSQYNTALIAKKIMDIYNFNNESIEYDVSLVRLHASNASVIFSIQGNYTDKLNNTSIEYNPNSIPLDTSSKEGEEEEIPFSDTLKMTGRPMLFSRNECHDVADGLLGSRGKDSYSIHILKLDTTTTLSRALDNLTCVVNSVYLDSLPAFSMTTKYDTYVTSFNTRHLVDNIWGNRSISNLKNQQLAVVTCDQGIQESEPTSEMRIDTNFDFILNPQKGLSLRVINCYSTFCLLQITSNACLLPKISDMGSLPVTSNNLIKHRQKRLSMLSFGVENIIMRLQSISSHVGVVETEIIKGLETTKISGSIITICVNVQNLPCSQDEANYHGAKVLTTIKMQANVGDLFINLENVTKSETIGNIFMVNYYGNLYQGHVHDIITEYQNDFRSCPKLAMSTGNNRFFYEDNAVYEIKCVVCPINTYYYETSMLPSTYQNTKTMYVHITDDGGSSDGTTTTYYTISPSKHTFPPEQRLYSEFIIEIGTILTLQLAPVFNGGQSIATVECEGQSLKHNRISSTEITIDITMELSGKMISVYIDNPLLPSGSQFLTRPAYVLPRYSEIIGTCEKCPTNTFSGSYGATDVSACENMKTHTTAARRLLSIDESKLTTMSAVTFMEIGDQLLFVLGIQDSTAHPESDFSIDIVLQYDNLTFAQDHITTIAKKVLQTYNFNNMSMEYNVSSILFHSSNASVIFGIYGNYTDNFPILTNNVSIEYNSTSIIFNTTTHIPTTTPTYSNYTDNFNNASFEKNSTSMHMNTSNANSAAKTEDISIFGLSFLHSIIGLSGAGVVLLIVIAIIISVIMKQKKHTEGYGKALIKAGSGYCIVCQGEVAV